MVLVHMMAYDNECLLTHICHMYASFEKAECWVLFTVNLTRFRTMTTYLQDSVYEGFPGKFNGAQETNLEYEMYHPVGLS